ncbi:MAG: hypothetical protein QM831_29545 [Kofleriaceae bacterium]
MRRRKELRVWFVALKATFACAHCGEADPDCLHFHHDDPSTKSFEVANGVGSGLSRERILAEIRKCTPLCGNCHAKLHWRVLP